MAGGAATSRSSRISLQRIVSRGERCVLPSAVRPESRPIDGLKPRLTRGPAFGGRANLPTIIKTGIRVHIQIVAAA
jgi:hypothetical protein